MRIPRYFYDDHRDRGLDTPVALRVTKRHVWVDPADPAIPELISDARYYSDYNGMDPCFFGLVSSARATVRALGIAS